MVTFGHRRPLSLSPALCACVLLKAQLAVPSRRPESAYVLKEDRSIAGVDGYASLVRRFVRFAVLRLYIAGGLVASTGWLVKSTPTGFLPSEDQGAIFGEIVLPEGASSTG